ncbi:MAG: glutamate synthase subunit beta [Myxococcales bacterium]|nr:glutamate synthase subunit beta [Myxococcales bacterium]
MGKITGFLEFKRKSKRKRTIDERLQDWRDVEALQPEDELHRQAARCMDCGIPFCSSGCPINNVIPDFNDMVYRGQWRDALTTLLETNNFPEFTGRICPAPCEKACVLDINDDPVSICQLERSIIDRAFEEGWIEPIPPRLSTGRQIAVIGSGPAGLTVAQQLRRQGHEVTVFEKQQRAGGLLTYGIPDFKLEKWVVERRIQLLEEEGVIFRCGVTVGSDLSVDELRRRFDAICLCCGAETPRELPLPGRELGGIHLAMDYLVQQNRRVAEEHFDEAPLTAMGKTVVVIGGGDTASDCIGTANRQGARKVIQVDYHELPPADRSPETPWPMWPKMFTTSSSQEEGVLRMFGLLTRAFLGDERGQIRALQATELEWFKRAGQWRWRERPESLKEIPVDLLLIAVGFTGPPRSLVEAFEIEIDQRGAVRVDERYMTTQPGVFCAGDMMRGASLVVWAIHDGRSAADGINAYLSATATNDARPADTRSGSSSQRGSR